MTHRLGELSHTADVGFEVRAPALEGLFEGAARGLVEALGAEAAPDEDGPAAAEGGAAGGDAEVGAGGGRRGDRSRFEPVRLARPDLERLLVHWLRELLARAMAEGEVPEARVREVRPPEGGEEAALRAEVRWRPVSAEGPAREIKGVTYHGLRVAREEEGWHARVVLDV